MNATSQHATTAHKGFLLDTSVISLLAPGREPHVPVGFADWLRTRSEQVFIPCIAVAELAQGIGKLRRSGGTQRADRLDQWLDKLIAGYGERILGLDAAAARLAGSLSDEAIALGRHPGFADVAIAALALHASCLLLTSNVRHFQPLGIACADPLVQLPA